LKERKVSVIPFGYVLHGARSGRWRDHHIGAREQRKPVFVFTLASMLLGLLVLARPGWAPWRGRCT